MLSSQNRKTYYPNVDLKMMINIESLYTELVQHFANGGSSKSFKIGARALIYFGYAHIARLSQW
jgi:hypothetical protein